VGGSNHDYGNYDAVGAAGSVGVVKVDATVATLEVAAIAAGVAAGVAAGAAAGMQFDLTSSRAVPGK